MFKAGARRSVCRAIGHVSGTTLWKSINLPPKLYTYSRTLWYINDAMGNQYVKYVASPPSLYAQAPECYGGGD
jgi:hypothetical protein